MRLATVWLLLVATACLVAGATHNTMRRPASAEEPALLEQEAVPAPGPGAAADACPFTLRVAGRLIPVNKAPEEDRYIISAHSQEHRARLTALLAAAMAPSGRPCPAQLTRSMPLLVGRLTRQDLLWLCQDPQASACVDYIERDEKMSIA